MGGPNIDDMFFIMGTAEEGTPNLWKGRLPLLDCCSGTQVKLLYWYSMLITIHIYTPIMVTSCHLKSLTATQIITYVRAKLE